jgi:hypothetical protein
MSTEQQPGRQQGRSSGALECSQGSSQRCSWGVGAAASGRGARALSSQEGSSDRGARSSRPGRLQCSRERRCSQWQRSMSTQSGSKRLQQEQGGRSTEQPAEQEQARPDEPAEGAAAASGTAGAGQIRCGPLRVPWASRRHSSSRRRTQMAQQRRERGIQPGRPSSSWACEAAPRVAVGPRAESAALLERSPCMQGLVGPRGGAHPTGVCGTGRVLL